MKPVIALGLSLLCSLSAYALPLGNPSEASLLRDPAFSTGTCVKFCQYFGKSGVAWCDNFSVRFGFYGDYVFNRHLQARDGNNHKPDIEHFQIHTNAVYLVANLYNRIDIFTTLGASSMRLDANAKTFIGNNGSRLAIESVTDFSGSLGIRSTLWVCKCFALGVEAQYFATKPDIWYARAEASSSSYPASTINMKYKEWQAGIGASYRIWNFVPYAGYKFSHVDLDMDDANLAVISGGSNFIVLLHEANQKLRSGYAVGVTFIDCDKASITLEARYPDETALYANCQLRF